MGSLFAVDRMVTAPNIKLLEMQGDNLDHEVASLTGLAKGLSSLESDISDELIGAVTVSMEAFEATYDSSKLGLEGEKEGIISKVIRKIKELFAWLKDQVQKVYQWVIGLFRSSKMISVGEVVKRRRSAGEIVVKIPSGSFFNLFKNSGTYRAFVMTSGPDSVDIRNLADAISDIIDEAPKPFQKGTAIYNPSDVQNMATEIERVLEFASKKIVQNRGGIPDDLFAYEYDGNDITFRKMVDRRFPKDSANLDLSELTGVIDGVTTGALFGLKSEKRLREALTNADRMLKVLASGSVEVEITALSTALRKYIKLVRSSVMMMQSVAQFILKDVSSLLENEEKKK